MIRVTERGSRCHPLYALVRTVVRTRRGVRHSVRPYKRRSRCWRGGESLARTRRSVYGGARIGYRKAAVKRSPDRLPIGLRAARSPPRKSAGAARRPSRECLKFRGKSRARLIPETENKKKVKVRYGRGRLIIY